MQPRALNTHGGIRWKAWKWYEIKIKPRDHSCASERTSPMITVLMTSLCQSVSTRGDTGYNEIWRLPDILYVIVTREEYQIPGRVRLELKIPEYVSFSEEEYLSRYQVPNFEQYRTYHFYEYREEILEVPSTERLCHSYSAWQRFPHSILYEKERNR